MSMGQRRVSRTICDLLARTDMVTFWGWQLDDPNLTHASHGFYSTGRPCPFCGGSNARCFGVRLDTGGYNCHKCGTKGGGPLDFLKALHGKTLTDAIKTLERFVGSNPEPAQRVVQTTPQREYRTPQPWSGSVPVQSGPVMNYLTRERCISVDTIRRYGVMQKGNWIVWPFRPWDGGDPILYKYRKIGERRFASERDCRPSLFGWQAIRDVDFVIIAEGELEALTLSDCGLNALSVPYGAGNTGFLRFDCERLMRFRHRFVLFDNDEAGRRGAAQLADKIDATILSLPDDRKDPNEMLMAGEGERLIRALRLSADTLRVPQGNSGERDEA